MKIEELLFKAELKKDAEEIKRLKRLIERLDGQKRMYGRIQRGELEFNFNKGYIREKKYVN